mmetsp:Transcript_12636/g.23849  ORF Transcript_12636/g.23849 Transcript_12636/m.23849 type:complete len:176 (+) Transcript_12636:77-604(+)
MEKLQGRGENFDWSFICSRDGGGSGREGGDALEQRKENELPSSESKRSKRKRKSSTWLQEQYVSDFDNLKEDEDFSRCVGQHVGIWWDLDNCFYYATVLAYNDSDGKCEVLYDDDGVREWLDFSKVRIDWGKSNAQEVGQSSGSPGSSATVATSTMARTFSARPPCKLRSVLCLF